MPSRERIENDPELKRFAQELMMTREGAIYTRRWRLLKEQREILKEALRSKDVERIAHARSNYIVLADLCSEAISELEAMHHWPT